MYTACPSAAGAGLTTPINIGSANMPRTGPHENERIRRRTIRILQAPSHGFCRQPMVALPTRNRYCPLFSNALRCLLLADGGGFAGLLSQCRCHSLLRPLHEL